MRGAILPSLVVFESRGSGPGAAAAASQPHGQLLNQSILKAKFLLFRFCSCLSVPLTSNVKYLACLDVSSEPGQSVPHLWGSVFHAPLFHYILRYRYHGNPQSLPDAYISPSQPLSPIYVVQHLNLSMSCSISGYQDFGLRLCTSDPENVAHISLASLRTDA